MAEEEYVIDGYCFSSQAEYDRGRKEKETIVYLTANTDMDDMDALLRIYNRFVGNASFQTIIGQQFLYDLRRRLVDSQIVGKDTLAPVPVVPFGKTGGQAAGSGDRGESDVLMKRYKRAYEEAVASRRIKNVLITVLLLVVVGMFVITATTRYSVFTYFTDYETKIRNKVEDEMVIWQQELQAKEEELQQREDQLRE